MLRLSAPTRRSICRSLFLLLGVMPLLSSIAFAAWHRTTLTEERAEMRLAAMLGLDSRIDDLVTPVPKSMRVGRASLLDPETGMPVIKAVNVESRIDVGGSRLHVDAIRIPGNKLGTAWSLLFDRVLKQRRLVERPIYLDASRATLVTADGELELFDLHFEVAQQQDARNAVVARLDFLWNRKSDDRVSLKITRSSDPNSKSDMRTEIRIETGDTPLPCSLLLADSHLATHWGPKLSFQGIGWIDESRGIYSGEFAGNLDGIELNRVLGDKFAGSIRGVARAQIQQASFTDSRLQELKAQLHVEGGSIDSELLKSFRKHLGVQTSTATQQTKKRSLPFDQADVWFQIDEKGLAYVGTSRLDGTPTSNAPSGTLLTVDGIRLAVDPQKQPPSWSQFHVQPTVNLIRALAGRNSQDFPLDNPACVKLWQWLPVGSAELR